VTRYEPKFTLFELVLVLVRLDHLAMGRRKRESARLWDAHPKRRCTTNQYGRSMKARLRRQRRETAMLVEQAQRVMRESRELLEQREAQLKQQEQFLEQHATIAHEMLRDRAIHATPL